VKEYRSAARFAPDHPTSPASNARSRGLTDGRRTGNHGNPERTKSDEGPPEDRGTRRLLFVLLGILVLGAVALLVLLFWLLRPEASADSSAAEGGYPIQVVTTIYGYGEEPNELVRTPLGVTFDPDGNVWISNTASPRRAPRTARVRTVGADGPARTALRAGRRGTRALRAPTTAAERSRCSRPRAGT
jgi:hypothetical protein